LLIRVSDHFIQVSTILNRPPPAFRLPAANDKTAVFEVAEDANDDHIESPPAGRFSVGGGKENASTMSPLGTITTSASKHDIRHSPVKAVKVTSPQHSEQPPTTIVRTSEEQEPADLKEPARHTQLEEEAITRDADIEMEDQFPDVVMNEDGKEEIEGEEQPLDVTYPAGLEQLADDQTSTPSSPSESTTPAKSILRKKSSLTFATLPAREPITTKKSLGPQTSRLSQFDPSRSLAITQDNLDAGGSPTDVNVEESDKVDEHLHAVQADEDHDKPDQKTSTQILHERFAMLGKTGQPRLSKSIPSFVAQAQTQESVSNTQASTEREQHEENDEDWIGPISGSKESLSLKKALSGSVTASASQDVVDTSPKSKTLKTQSPMHSIRPVIAQGQSDHNTVTVSPTSKLPLVSYPKLSAHNQSTTPAGSPIRASTTPAGSPPRAKVPDGAMSASRNKLFSVLKSAKGLFGTSSTPAKTETQQTVSPVRRPVPARSLSQPETNWTIVEESTPPKAHVEERLKDVRQPTGRRTRSSIERAAKAKLTENEKIDRDERMVDPEEPTAEEDAIVPAPKSMLPTSQVQKPGDLRRPLRAGMRPAPVSIRLASQRVSTSRDINNVCD